MSQIIIGLCGPIASGKGELKKYLEKKYQAVGYKFSDFLRQVLQSLYIPINRENLQNLSIDLRSRFGNDILAKAMAQTAIHSTKKIIVIDGVRRLDDIKYLLPLKNFTLISINADTEIRYERAKQRNENEGDQDKSLEQFILDDKKETEIEIPLVMTNAHYQITNNADIESLHKNIDLIFQNLKKEI